MRRSKRKCSPRPEQGFSLMEVLVSILITAIGLLGLAGLQTKANEIEMEAYQRSVALALVQDMGNRITAGREYATELASDKVYGTGDGEPEVCPKPENPTKAQKAARHFCEWSNAMKGAAEKTGAGSIGAPIGMRGCVLAAPASTAGSLADYFVVGVWQGLTPTASPPAGTQGAACASGVDYGPGLRRAVVMRVLIPKLSPS